MAVFSPLPEQQDFPSLPHVSPQQDAEVVFSLPQQSLQQHADAFSSFMPDLPSFPPQHEAASLPLQQEDISLPLATFMP